MTELKKAPKLPWYHTRIFVIIALLTIGPLALPFLLKSPRFHPITKAALSIGIILLMVYLIVITAKLSSLMLKEVQILYR